MKTNGVQEVKDYLNLNVGVIAQNLKTVTPDQIFGYMLSNTGFKYKTIWDVLKGDRRVNKDFTVKYMQTVRRLKHDNTYMERLLRTAKIQTFHNKPCGCKEKKQKAQMNEVEQEDPLVQKHAPDLIHTIMEQDKNKVESEPYIHSDPEESFRAQLFTPSDPMSDEEKYDEYGFYGKGIPDTLMESTPDQPELKLERDMLATNEVVELKVKANEIAGVYSYKSELPDDWKPSVKEDHFNTVPQQKKQLNLIQKFIKLIQGK